MAKLVIIALVVFLAVIGSHETAATLSANQMKVFEVYNTVYYDPVGNLTLKSEIENSGRFPFTRIGFRSLPCACQELSCGCCAGINITRIKFDQKACTNFTYDPYDFAIRMDVAMNDRQIFTNKISAKNPPPICVPLPYIPAINLCIKFYDVHIPDGKNLHACIDFETRIIQSPVLVLHFDCVKMGADGISWSKPEGNGDVDTPNVDYDPPIIAEPEVYDEVNFESSHSDLQATNAALNSSLTNEDEDKIGQLKL